MALTREEVVDSIELREDGRINVRKAIRIMDGDELVAQKYHRHVVEPGQDLTSEDPRVKSLATVDHTAGRVAAFNAKRSRREEGKKR